LTARERIEVLLGPDSFEECDMFVEHAYAPIFGMENEKGAGDGVVTGRWNHQWPSGISLPVRILPVLGGSLSETNARKMAKLQDMAMELGAPIGAMVRGVRRGKSGSIPSRGSARFSNATLLRFSAWCRRFQSSWAPARVVRFLRQH